MNFGLSVDDYAFLKKTVIDPLKKKSARVFVFGSRATGKHHTFSDIDILYVPLPNEGLTGAEMSAIKEAIEESKFPIKVDIVGEDDLADSYRDRVNLEKIEV